MKSNMVEIEAVPSDPHDLITAAPLKQESILQMLLRLGNGQEPSGASLLKQLPSIYRLIDVQRTPLSPKSYRMEATLFHDQASLRVGWKTSQPDIRLKPGVLVTPWWKVGSPVPSMGVLEISRLAMTEIPDRRIDLFSTVPHSWVSDRDLLRRATALIDALAPTFRELVHAIFWEGARFERFCRGPSSLKGHHCHVNENLRHSVETAEATLALLPQFPSANASIALTAALLHDAGKSDDYVLGEPMLNLPNRMSDWGRLIGHKTTVVFWIGDVHRKLRMRLSDDQLQSLLHALNAASGAPAHLGMRAPITPESILLSLADRASGKGNLLARQQAPGGGWGKEHAHLAGAPFTVNQQ